MGNNPGEGTLSGTLTQNTVEGVATFPGLSINNAGIGYTLTASAAGVASATSTLFDITATGRRAIVANSNSGTTTVIDVVTNQVVATLSTTVLPYGATVSPDGSFALVADFGDIGAVNGKLYRLDLAAAEPAVVGTINTTQLEGPGIPHPESTVITPDGRFDIVGDGAPQVEGGAPETDVISIDLQSGLIASTVSNLPGNQGVALTPDGGMVLVLSADTRQVSYLSLVNGVLTDTGDRTQLPGESLDAGPRSITVTPDGTLALVTDVEADLVHCDQNQYPSGCADLDVARCGRVRNRHHSEWDEGVCQ